MLTLGPDEPIGNEDERAIRVRHGRPRLAQHIVEQLPQSQFFEPRPHHQHGPLRGGLEHVHRPAFAVDFGLSFEHTLELGQEVLQHILASRVGDGALFHLAVLSVRLDDAYLLVDGAVGGRNFDGADVHAKELSRLIREESSKNQGKLDFRFPYCVITFFEDEEPEH